MLGIQSLELGEGDETPALCRIFAKNCVGELKRFLLLAILSVQVCRSMIVPLKTSTACRIFSNDCAGGLTGWALLKTPAVGISGSVSLRTKSSTSR